MATLDRPDGTLVYDVTGTGPPLFLVTGLGGTRGYWSNIVPALAKRFTVVTHDHMGTGQTESRRTHHTVDALAQDVLALMNHLDIKKARLVGHSTGAGVGQILAQDAPDRLDAMVLYAGWAGPDPFFRLCFEARKTLLLRGGMNAYHAATPLFLYPPSWISEDPGRLDELIGLFVRTSPPVETLAARIDMLLAFDRRPQLGKIAVPTLILCAQDDQLTPPHLSEELARGITGAQLATLNWGGHAASQTNPEGVLSAIERFFDARLKV